MLSHPWPACIKIKTGGVLGQIAVEKLGQRGFDRFVLETGLDLGGNFFVGEGFPDPVAAYQDELVLIGQFLYISYLRGRRCRERQR
jgi:hypothetical protein